MQFMPVYKKYRHCNVLKMNLFPHTHIYLYINTILATNMAKYPQARLFATIFTVLILHIEVKRLFLFFFNNPTVFHFKTNCWISERSQFIFVLPEKPSTKGSYTKAKLKPLHATSSEQPQRTGDNKGGFSSSLHCIMEN